MEPMQHKIGLVFPEQRVEDAHFQLTEQVEHMYQADPDDPDLPVERWTCYCLRYGDDHISYYLVAACTPVATSEGNRIYDYDDISLIDPSTTYSINFCACAYQ